MRIRPKLLLAFLSLSVLTLSVSFWTSYMVQEESMAQFREVGGQDLPGSIALARMSAEFYHAEYLLSEFERHKDQATRRAIEKALANLASYAATHELYHADEEVMVSIGATVRELSRLISSYLLLNQKGADPEELEQVRRRIHVVAHEFSESIVPHIEKDVAAGFKKIGEVESSGKAVRATMQVYAGLVLLAVLVLSFLVANHLAAPLHLLRDAARKIGAGRLDLKLPVTSKDEHGELAAAFNEMSGSLAKALGDLNAANRQLQQDVQERQALAEALEQHRRNLEQQVVERTRDLSEAKEAAETANVAKGSFLANMSHEIRTPLNGVVGMIEILERTRLDADQQRMLQTIRDSSFSLLGIINDILDASKIEAGELKIERVEVDVLPLIERTAESVVQEAAKKNLRLILYVDPKLYAWFYTDPTRLRQILLNLLSNAVKFSVRLDPQSQSIPPVHVRARLIGADRLHLTVEDGGIGMSQETVAKLFRPFSQAEDSTTRKFGGTGLGMAITKNLVERMGGTLEVESALGKGTKVTVTLALEKADDQERIPNIAGLTVFMVYDKPELYGDLYEFFGHFGATVRVAQDNRELAQWVDASAGEEIVILGASTSEEVSALYEELAQRNPKTRFVCLEPDRAAKMGLVSSRRYVSYRYPWHLSDVVRGLAALAKRVDGPEQGDTVSEASAPKTEAAQARGRILLVEDNEVNQEVILAQLELLGYAADVAQDGKEGLAKWQAGDFVLVLSDCHMPEMDGFEMTAAIRAQEAERGSGRIPIIAITANALRGEAERCYASGMDDYLSKPVQLKVLEQKLAEWMARVAA